MAADFEQHGEAVIKILRTESPSDYCRLVAGLVPKELDLEISNKSAEVHAWMAWVTQTPSNVQTIAKSEAIEPPPLAYLEKKPAPPRLKHEPWSESEHQEPTVEKPRLQITPGKSDKF